MNLKFNDIKLVRVRYNGKQSFHSQIYDSSTKKPAAFATVKLFHQTKNEFVESFKTDSNGEFQVKDIDIINNTFFVISHKNGADLRGDMIDNITGDGGRV